MKKILIVLFIGLLSSSCASTFFYTTLASPSKDVEQVENGDFLINEDSLWIAYSFNGEDAPIQVTVFNKSANPIYIDWNKSALILGNQTHAYPNNVIGIEAAGKIDRQFDLFDIDGGFVANYTGKINLPTYVSFVPPQTMISHIPAWLKLVDYSGIPKKSYVESALADKNGEPCKVQRILFDEVNTPLSFKCYLTVYMDESRQIPKIFTQEFYIKDIIKAKGLSPKKMDPMVMNRGDLFYVEKPANTTGLQVLAGAGIIVGATAVEIIIENNNR